MAQQTSSEQVFFQRSLESSFNKLILLMKSFLARPSCIEQPGQARRFLRCGTLLSRLSGDVSDASEGRDLLSRLYLLVADNTISLAKDGSLHEQQLCLLRFLVAYAQRDSSVIGDVKKVVENIFQETGEAFRIQITSASASRRDSRFPPYLDYEYLMFLVELFVSFHDTSAYVRLEKYCAWSLDKQAYHDICSRHRLLGFFSLLSGPFQSIAKDIVLQNLYRTRFRHTALKNDPWRFVEQVFLYQLTCPDVTVFRFMVPLLRKLIENQSQSLRYADPCSDPVVEATYAVANSLDWYKRISEQYENVERKEPLNAGRSIWDSASVLESVDGEFVPPQSAPQQYSMATFIVSQVVPGALFFLPDRNWKGTYRLEKNKITRAFALGAAAIVTSSMPETLKGRPQFIVVRNTFTALLRLALENRERYLGKVVGITGSVGKTTTATMLHDLLSFFGTSYKNISFFNHETGVPKSVANIPQESDFAIIEMGMGRPGTILPKVVLARPHVVLVTELQYDHMEFHDSINSVIETKMEIVDALEPGGTVILNRDSRYFASMLGILKEKGTFRLLTFGEHPLADVHAVSLQLHPDFSEIDVEVNNLKYHYKLSLPGMHMALNSLAACAVLHALNIDLQQALPHFYQLRPASGRNEILNIRLGRNKNVQVIDDSFNANPASMRSSFHVLSLMTPGDGGRRIMVVGDMGELGEKTRAYHEALAEDINQSRIDIFYSIGEYSGYLNSKIQGRIEHRHFSSMEALRGAVLHTLHDGDIISFKGSARAGDMKEIIDSLTHLQSE